MDRLDDLALYVSIIDAVLDARPAYQSQKPAE